MSNMTRGEHLQWCKDRALECVDQGNLDEAVASMLGDLGKHPETVDHPAKKLFLMLRFGGHLESPGKVREFIEGFN